MSLSQTAAPTAPIAPAAPPTASAAATHPLSSLRTLAIDVALPLGSYFLLRDGLGASLWLSLAVSSIGPAARSAWGLVRGTPNPLAGLMLAVNIAGIAVSFLTGDPRLMIAKDSVVSSVIAFAILGSAAARRPLLSVGLKAYLTRDTAERVAAWDRLAERSRRFRGLELLFSGIWGTALLAECAARLIGAFTLPVATMAWLGTVFTVGAIGLAVMLGGVAAVPMDDMIKREMSENSTAG